nr:uncharacterized protein LOC117840432 [Setaria viridis]
MPPPPLLHQSPPPPSQRQASDTQPMTRHRKKGTFDMSKEYLAMFSGPLPEGIIQALTNVFNLNDEEVEQMDIDMAAMVGDGIGSHGTLLFGDGECVLFLRVSVQFVSFDWVVTET